MKSSSSKLLHLISIFIIYTLFCFSSAPYYTAVAAEEEGKVTQLQFMFHLANVMGLKLPENAHAADCIKALELRGITIPGGYRPNEFITAKQMAIMLIPAMGLDKTKFERIKKQIGLSYKDRAVIINIVGDVKIKPRETDKWDTAKPGTTLGLEDIIKTGKDSAAVVRLGEISVVKIKQNTTITVYQLAKEPIIYMERGNIILDTRGSPHASLHYIITPTTVAAARGTIIEAIHKQEPQLKLGVTTIIVAQGETDIYNVTGYPLIEKLEMARKDKFPVKGINVPEGNYIEKDKIYPLTEQEKESIHAEVEKTRVCAETNLLGSAAEKFLKEEGISDKDYLKIDILGKNKSTKNIVKNIKE